MEYYDIFLSICCLSEQHKIYKADSCSAMKSLSLEGDVLNIQKMKRRAFRLRRLIDRSKNKEEKKEAIREYVGLIKRISRNDWKGKPKIVILFLNL